MAAPTGDTFPPFTDEQIASLVGKPVTVNFGRKVGEVVAARRSSEGVEIEFEGFRGTIHL